ncbi:MAG TPA: maleylpyruvate isomerase family mycothiol-dependent enzyme [Acidimicrobiales bacterium]|nr:maleylpyruvate isomerase family mycothiol-dependent enzyme [Acidimicrobiales bacterium]
MGVEPVVEVLAEEWRAIVELGRLLDDNDWDLPTECPGWTVRDLVSHMVGTERSLLGEPAPPVEAEPPPHVHNEVGARNEAWVAARRSVPGHDVLDEFHAVTRRRLDALRSMPNERFDEIGPSPVGPVPYREFMRVRVMDCWVHEQDMRVATGRPGHASGDAASLSLERISSAMPYVVGKRAGAPDGASVRFELRGSWPRRMDVAVRQGRAGFDVASGTEPARSQPTVTLDMDAETFWRLGCGRVPGDAALAAGLVEVRGDTALGETVLRAMAFMI